MKPTAPKRDENPQNLPSQSFLQLSEPKNPTVLLPPNLAKQSRFFYTICPATITNTTTVTEPTQPIETKMRTHFTENTHIKKTFNSTANPTPHKTITQIQSPKCNIKQQTIAFLFWRLFHINNEKIKGFYNTKKHCSQNEKPH